MFITYVRDLLTFAMSSYQQLVRNLRKAPSTLEKYEWNIPLPPTLFTKKFTTESFHLKQQQLSTESLSKAGKCLVWGFIWVGPQDVKLYTSLSFKDSKGDTTFGKKPFAIIDFMKGGTVLNSIQKDFRSTKFYYDVNDNTYSIWDYAKLSDHLTSSPLTRIRVSFFIEVEGSTPSLMELENISGTNSKCNLNHLANTFKPSLETFCTSEPFSDIVICCENEEFPAQIVLSVASSVFLKMFESDMKENDEKRVVIQDMSKTTVGFLLKWIYSGEVNVPDFRNTVDLFKAAHKYCIDPLKNWCVTQIIKNYVTVDNVGEIFALSQTYEDASLLDKAKEIIKGNKKIIFKNQESLQEFFQQYPELEHELILM